MAQVLHHCWRRQHLFDLAEARPASWQLLLYFTLACACLTQPVSGCLADPPAADKGKPAETKKVELHRLTNEELLKQAEAIYQAAARDYLAQTRALAMAEMLLDEVRKQLTGTKGAAPAETKQSAGQPAGEEAAKKAVEVAKARQADSRRTLKLVQAQKELLDRVATSLDGCRSAALAFQNVLDDLRPYAIETRLRVKDGSLAEDKAPDALKSDNLEQSKKKLTEEMARLTTRAGEIRQGQEAIAKLLEKTSKAALAADADVVEESRNLARQQQRQALEQTHARKSTADMIAELARMVDEGIGLKGTYVLALDKFTAREREATKIKKALDTLKQPEAKIPQLSRAEDVETAARAIQKQIEYFGNRGKHLEAQRAALTALTRDGGEFEADAAVSEEHLFKMEVLAKLLKAKGVPEKELPEKARPGALQSAALKQKESAAAVRAATEKAKADLALVSKQLAEAGAAATDAAKQLANLKETQDVTLAALKWEERLKGLTGTKVAASFATTRQELAGLQKKLKEEEDGYSKAATAATEARARLDGLTDPFIRDAEAQGQAEKQKLLGDLRKQAGLERAGITTNPAPSPGEPKKTDPQKKPALDTRTELEKAADRLLAFQQLLAGRVRVLDERQARKKELVVAYDQLEKQAAAYSKTLAAARLLALELNATAVDLKKRLGQGELSGDKIPEGITDALRLETRTKLEATITSVLNTQNQLQQARETLLRPDPDAEALTAATRELVTVVGRRLDLLADLKRLAADYQRDKSARSPSELKRLDQRAAERLSAESSGWDTLLGIDSSKNARSLADLLEAFYRELIDIEDREANLKKQREKVEQLVELTREETTIVGRVLPMLARQMTRLEAAREEDAVLARARLRPEQAEELLKAFQTKTGRLLAKPLPVADKDRAEKVEELANLLFERYVMVEAARKWEEVLNARIAASGVKAEAGVYQDELSRLNATSAANNRRVQALTGQDQPGPASGGDIGQTRSELAHVRTQGVQRMALKIGIILLIAFLLPRLLMWILRRTGGDASSLVLSALRAVLKTAIWVAALTMILSILGVDVTAIIAGLGIGGLAIGLAAQPMIADMIGAIVIFAERRFKIGDVIRLGNDDPARVIGLTWRSTQVRNTDGLVVTIPNRKVTEAMIQNLTREGATYDGLNVSITTPQDVNRVLAVITQAMAECPHLAAAHGVAVKEFSQKGGTKTVKYRFWWFLTDYEARNRTRDEVFAHISANLAHEDMSGTEISLA
jgi:small-conductance mechanosensitive channel